MMKLPRRRPPHSLVTLLCLLPLAGCGNVEEEPPVETDAAPPGADAAEAHDEVDAAAQACEPSTSVCSSGELVVCDDQGSIAEQVNCALDCHPDGSRCYDVDPSNGLAPFLDQAETAPALTLDEGSRINTDTGEIEDSEGNPIDIPSDIVGAPADGVDVRVFRVSELTVEGAVLVVPSQLPAAPALAIVSDGPIVLRGMLSLSTGLRDRSAPGSVTDDVTCAGDDGQTGYFRLGGGGGGGFGSRGGPGGTVGELHGGGGGHEVGNPSLVPLRGGCPGGGKTGRGGGAVQLVSRDSIRLEIGESVGVVNAGGGGAINHIGAGTRAGAGGGSGGGILLEAPVVSIAAGAGLTANGGAGGGACGAPGESGSLSISQAEGPVCPDPTKGDGGNGGALEALEGDSGGEADDTTESGGGGGGGGVGRIRVNTADASLDAESSSIVSPAPSLSLINRR